MEKYRYPEVFVEGVESDKYVLEINEHYILVLTKEDLEKYVNYKRVFGHIIYEHIINYIDLVKPATKKAFIVIPEYSGEKEMNGFLIDENKKLCLIEVKGIQPYVFPREGDEIEERDKVAYIITGKGEVRTIRSPCKGVVLLVINFPWEKPEKYVLAVVNKNDIREITIRKSP
ncbi:conserved hypothetical protein [Staphylothermus marinus F1]|uniref:DUF2118 domain-containing protein n=1 Tax=Staphylothermus marinus (strain ATCC 43588 / DSM 3639 / JCM 9404 / F1) TaxID=399550 RepID=A3DMR4_STAMF|nr:DUF2118 domain-containing protein [Staphylothermus marinus]ABN69924.1 conserved hypothetical protein [Staphylothermus marinus F1]